jgi:hypothetical protein
MVFIKGAWFNPQDLTYDDRFYEHFCCPDHRLLARVHGDEDHRPMYWKTFHCERSDNKEIPLDYDDETLAGQFVVRPDWCPLRATKNE